MALSLYSLTSISISLTIFITLLFFFINLSYPHLKTPSKVPHRILLNSTHQSCSSILETPHLFRCKFSVLHCSPSNGLINYFSLHFCIFQETPFVSIPFLGLCVLLQFYVLVKTAQSRFSVVVTKLVSHLSLSPSMGAVTLLALGNGAPDVFASVAAVGGGQARTGFGAILSAGTFVSAFVVGFVAIYAAPFSVLPGQFVRDVLFYLTAALFLFYVYLSAEIYLWQAVGFVGFYLFFVGVVFWMDLGMGSGKGKGGSGSELGFVGGGDVDKGSVEVVVENVRNFEKGKPRFGFWKAFEQSVAYLMLKTVLNPVFLFFMISKAWEVPVSLLLKLTVPEPLPSEWSKFYRSANIALCPLLLLYTCKSFMPLDHPVVFLLQSTHFPLWSVVLIGSSSLALLHYIVEKDPPKSEQMPIVIAAFVMSVFWISTVAGELLNCLAALGSLLHLPPALLGLTVLAWGNSVGDLVADVAVAKAGQPAMAMAGCFAGPMFNMLFGLGTALVIQTSSVYPEAYELHFHVSIVVAFIFLLLSLMGSLLVVTWCRFRVPRFWGFCLVCLYIVFIIVSLIIARFSI